MTQIESTTCRSDSYDRSGCNNVMIDDENGSSQSLLMKSLLQVVGCQKKHWASLHRNAKHCQAGKINALANLPPLLPAAGTGILSTDAVRCAEMLCRMQSKECKPLTRPLQGFVRQYALEKLQLAPGGGGGKSTYSTAGRG